MKMKKILSIVLVIILVISTLAGCSNKSILQDSEQQNEQSGNSITRKPAPGDTQTAQPSADDLLSGRYILVSWEDEDGDYLEHIISEGIHPESIFLELRSDGTYTWDFSALDMWVDEGTYKVNGGIALILTYDGGQDVLTVVEGRIFFKTDDDILIFEKTGATNGKELPAPPLNVKESLPASACGMYAMTSWTTDKGDDLLEELLLEDIRSDLLYIDFLADGRLLLSLHAAYPGFFAWGTYWVEGGSIVIEWLEDWDASWFPYGATLRGSTVTLHSSFGERLEFDKEFGGDFPPSAISYSDGYHGSTLGSAKTLEGTVLVVSIFVRNDQNSLWNDELLAGFRKILRYSMLYLEEIADYYDTPLRFYQYQTEIGADDLFYMMDLDGWLAGGDDSDDLIVGTRRDINDFIESNIPYRELAEKYRTNNITYVVFTTEADRSYAWPYYASTPPSLVAERYHEKSIVFLETGYVLIHEILHTFGAVDFYYEEGEQANRNFFGVSRELMEHIERNYPYEVMLRTQVSEPQLSPFTAYRLGWLDSIPELSQFPNFRLPGDVPGIMASYSFVP